MKLSVNFMEQNRRRPAQKLLSAYVIALVFFGSCGVSSFALAEDDDKPQLTIPSDAPLFRNVKRGSSEELLAAEGNWNLIEEGDVYDPAQAHMNARKKVNTRQMRKRADLVPHFEPDVENGRDSKFRVLKMKPQKDGWQEDLESGPEYQVTETSLAKPTQKVVGEDVVSQIRAAFVQPEVQKDVPQEVIVRPDVAPNAAIPVPSAKPERVQLAMVGGKMGILKPPPLPASKRLAVLRDVPQEPDFVLKSPPPVQKEKPSEGVLGTLRKTLGVRDKQEKSSTKTSLPARIQMKPGDQVFVSGTASGRTAKLTGFRSAIHEGQTRIAMDVSSSVKYKVAVDHIRNVLRVKLDNTQWQEPMTGTMRASKQLGTYVAKQQADGSVILEIRLKNKTKITDTVILKPDQTSHHRIVIDLEG